MPSLVEIAPKLSKLIPLLASDQPGEVVSAAAAIQRTLKSAGCDFHDLVNAIGSPPRAAQAEMDFDDPKPDVGNWGRMADYCFHHAGSLNDREAAFVRQMKASSTLGRRISPKQEAWLAIIYEKLQRVFR